MGKNVKNVIINKEIKQIASEMAGKKPYSNQKRTIEVLPEKTAGLPSTRRDFLKLFGFSLAATVTSGCDIPVRKAIPYFIKPEEIIPGESLFYASTFAGGGDYCSILVKTREGRPVKIEGNEMSGITGGGTNAS